MEHLALPFDPIKPQPLMPVLATHIYDGGPFLEYLDRHPHTLFSAKEYGPFEITESEVITHYQSWLFFGLLEECFGNSFDENDFIRFDEDGKRWVLDTSELSKQLRRWQDESLRALDSGDPRYPHLESCLDEVAEILRKAPWHFPDYGHLLGLQIDIIASVAEAIEHCVAEVNENFGKPIIGGYGLRWDWLRVSYQKRNDILDWCIKDMREIGGWCPNDIERSIKRFKTCEGWHYLRNLRLDQDLLRHKSCTEDKCEIVSTSQGICHPSHFEEDCCCNSFKVDCKTLEDIYTRGRIPCLKLLSDRRSTDSSFTSSIEFDLQITLESVRIEENSDISYVAISHVWSNGTGNSTANSLPKCQLWHMYRQAKGWRDANFPERRGQPLYIWIDTICCPCEQGKGKWLALSRMADIYGNAEFVLVVDRQLIAWKDGHLYRRGFLEHLVRIYFSPWMRRLWTCQEAILAGRRRRYTVVVQFGGVTWDWTTMYIRAAKDGQPAQKLAYDMSREFIWLEKGLWFGDDEFPPLGNPRALAHILQHRSTSVAADEALILSNLLMFDSRRYIGLTQEEAMCRFWAELSDVEAHNFEGSSLLPKQVVFYPVPRLETPGFRWAPRSFLNGDVQQLDAFFMIDSSKIPATLSPRGILAAYPSFRTYRASEERSVCIFGEKNCDRGEGSLFMPMADGSWRMTREGAADATTPPRDLIRKHNLCMLTHSTGVPEERMYTYALWVHLEEEINGIKYGRILQPTTVAQAQPNTVDLMIANETCALAILDELEQLRRIHGTDSDLDHSIVAEVSSRHVREYLTKHPEIQEKIKLDTRRNCFDRVKYTFEDCVRSFTVTVHFFCHIGRVGVEEYPDETMWCLD